MILDYKRSEMQTTFYLSQLNPIQQYCNWDDLNYGLFPEHTNVFHHSDSSLKQMS